eukprot:421202-Lingulodinium_polyedra.AAC.1
MPSMFSAEIRATAARATLGMWTKVAKGKADTRAAKSGGKGGWLACRGPSASTNGLSDASCTASAS